MWKTTLLATSLACVLAACGGGSSGGSGGEGGEAINPDATFTIASITVPSGFDPHKELHGGERPFWFLVFDRLTQMNTAGELEPMLATKWEVAPDGTSVTFTLRDDVTFNDGTAFDASAVKANFERAKNIEGSMVLPALESVDSVEAISPTEAKFNLNKSNPELPEILAGPAGAMVSPAVITAKTDISKDPGMAGSGPYAVAEFTPNEGVVYERADDENWDEDAGRLKQLEFKFIPDERTLVSALRAGELDAGYISPFRGASIKEAEGIAKQGQYDLKTSPSGVLNATLLRTTRLEKDVRQAIIQAVDREAITEGLLQGTCDASDQVRREGFPGYIENFEDPFPYDPAESKKLLAAAGKSNLTVELGYIAGREDIPQVIKADLAKVGVTVELTPLSSVEVLSAWRAGDLDMWAYQSTPDLSFKLSSNQLLLTSGVDMQDKAVLDAVASPLEVVDDAERSKAYAAAMQTVVEDAVLVPYCHFDAHWLVAKDVVGFDDAMLPFAQYMLDLRSVARTE